MEEMTLETLIAVFEEMFGAVLFWAMVAAAILITLGWLYVLIRDRSLGMRQFLVAQLFMPVDVIVFLGIAAMGAIGGAILVYTVERLLFRGSARGHDAG